MDPTTGNINSEEAADLLFLISAQMGVTKKIVTRLGREAQYKLLIRKTIGFAGG